MGKVNRQRISALAFSALVVVLYAIGMQAKVNVIDDASDGFNGEKILIEIC